MLLLGFESLKFMRNSQSKESSKDYIYLHPSYKQTVMKQSTTPNCINKNSKLGQPTIKNVTQLDQSKLYASGLNTKSIKINWTIKWPSSWYHKITITKTDKTETNQVWAVAPFSRGNNAIPVSLHLKTSQRRK